MPRLNLIGKKFNKLTVIKFSHIKINSFWECVCECGNKTIVNSKYLKKGHTRSCGCLRNKHNLYGTHIYNVWKSMLQRCNYVNSINYNDYGGRGIKVCDKWLNFIGFYEDVGESPRNMTLDRIDNNLGYCKENCKWSTIAEQNNNKRNNHLITYKEKTQTLSQWSKELGINYSTLSTRINKGNWTVERAMGTAIGGVLNY